MEKNRGITPNNEVFEECGDPRLMSKQQKEDMLTYLNRTVDKEYLKRINQLPKTGYILGKRRNPCR